MFYRILLFLQGEEDNHDCLSKIKSFSCVSLYLAHWRLFCLGFGFFSRMFCLPPGNLADHGSRSLGAPKADPEPLGSNQGSCFICCWKDVEYIYNRCVQQYLHPVPISKHGARGSSPNRACQNTTAASSDLKTRSSWVFCPGLGVRVWCHPSVTSSGEPVGGRAVLGAGWRRDWGEGIPAARSRAQVRLQP